MKSTNTELINCGLVEKQDGEKYQEFVLHFQLHLEDLHLAHLTLQFANEQHLAPEMDLADFLLSCITHEIHLLTEEMTGKPFVLRMDRKEKKA